MADAPKIPMLPSELPQQRVSLVVALPDRPADLEIEVGYGNFPDGVVPRQGVPRSPTLLVQVEWAETPMNNGIEAFYLHARKRHWLLWLRTLDDNVEPWAWRWLPVGYCPRRDIPAKTAAAHMLLEYWRFCESMGDQFASSDPFDWINETGMLGVSDIQAICRALDDRRARRLNAPP